MLLAGGTIDGVRVLSEESARLMRTDRLTAEQKKHDFLGAPQWIGRGFGLNLSVVTEPAKSAPIFGPGGLGTFSWPGAYGTWWQADPSADDLILLYLIQNCPDLSVDAATAVAGNTSLAKLRMAQPSSSAAPIAHSASNEMVDYPPGRIDGTRLVLRPPVLDDAGALFQRVARDPEVTKYLLWTPHPDVAATRRVITEKLNTADDDRTWAIALRNSGDVIGLTSCRRPVPHSVEIGYCIGRRWWGKGYMPEVLDMLLTALQADRTSTASGAPATSTTSGRRGCCCAPVSRWRAGWPVTPSTPPWGPNRRTACCTPRLCGNSDAPPSSAHPGRKSPQLLRYKHTQSRQRTLKAICAHSSAVRQCPNPVRRLRLPPA